MLGVLARLAASTTNYSNSGRGGEPVLSSIEVAGLLKGLSVVQLNYALAKYCADDLSFRAFQLHVMVYAAGCSARNNWRTVKGKPRVMSLGALAAIESVNPYLCFSHNSPAMLGDKACNCDKTRAKVSHADRYRYVQLSQSSWNEVWRSRYELIFSYCQVIDSEVVRLVSLNNERGSFCND